MKRACMSFMRVAVRSPCTPATASPVPRYCRFPGAFTRVRVPSYLHCCAAACICTPHRLCPIAAAPDRILHCPCLLSAVLDYMLRVVLCFRATSRQICCVRSAVFSCCQQICCLRSAVFLCCQQICCFRPAVFSCCPHLHAVPHVDVHGCSRLRPDLPSRPDGLLLRLLRTKAPPHAHPPGPAEPPPP